MREHALPVDNGNDIINSCQQNAARIGTATVAIWEIPVLFNE
jgi:hypothetical protein